MDLVTLKSQIKNKNLENFYIFSGPEEKVKDEYIKAMRKSFDSDIVFIYDVHDLIRRLGTVQMFKMRHIYVLRDCKDFLSSEELQVKFERFRASDSIVILTYTSIDKRSKLYKNFSDRIVQFDYLTEDILIKYIQRDIDLSDRNCRILIQICDRDYSRILLEIDKIERYGGDCNNSFVQLLQSGVIYQSPQDRIFDFVDAVMHYKPKKAFALWNECIEYGESPFIALTNLYNSTKQTLQCQSYEGKDLEKATGLTSGQIYAAKKRAGVYSDDYLEYFMQIIQKADLAIKRGLIEDYMVIPYILTMLWR